MTSDEIFETPVERVVEGALTPLFQRAVADMREALTGAMAAYPGLRAGWSLMHLDRLSTEDGALVRSLDAGDTRTALASVMAIGTNAGRFFKAAGPALGPRHQGGFFAAWGVARDCAMAQATASDYVPHPLNARHAAALAEARRRSDYGLARRLEALGLWQHQLTGRRDPEGGRGEPALYGPGGEETLAVYEDLLGIVPAKAA